MRVTLLCSVLLVFAASEVAQDFSHFEVASIRPAEPIQVSAGAPAGAVGLGSITGGIGTSRPTRITYRAVWLSGLIETAYNLRDFQLSGRPAWLGPARYDIVANIPEGTTKEQFSVMLQNMLRERFGLTFHRESKEFPIYALVVAKNGSKLRESPKETKEPAPAGTTPPRPPDENGFPSLASGYSGIRAIPGGGRMRLTGQRVSVTAIADFFEGGTGMLAGVDRPVFDETGMKGEYDFKLEFEYKRPGTVADASPDAAPSVFAALEKELGLKLEGKRMPLDVIVIDKLEKVPTEN